MSCAVLGSPGGDEPWGTLCSFTLRFGCSSLSPRRSWHRLQTPSNPLRRSGLIPQHPPESAGETQLGCESGDSGYGSAPAEPPQKHRHPPLLLRRPLPSAWRSSAELLTGMPKFVLLSPF